MPATIVDVARRAGVSTATVSRIMSGASASRPATVAAVRAAAEALDYRPSSIARSLKTRTTNTLGLIVTDVHNPFFPELVRAVEDAAWEHGLRIILCNGARDPRREADYLAFLQDGRVDGLIVAAGHLADGYAAQLARTAVPVVIVNSERADLGVPTIVSDNRAGGRLAAEHLLEHGHTRFAIVTGPTEGADAANRLQGALEALEQAGVARDEVPVVVGVGVATGGQSISGLLGGAAGHDRPHLSQRRHGDRGHPNAPRHRAVACPRRSASSASTTSTPRHGWSHRSPRWPSRRARWVTGRSDASSSASPGPPRAARERSG